MLPATRTLWKRLLVLAVILPVTGFVAFYAVIFVGAGIEEAWHSAGPIESAEKRAVIFVPDSSPGGFAFELVSYPAAAQFVAEHPGARFVVPLDRRNAVELEFSKHFDQATLGINPTVTGNQQITVHEFTPSGDADDFRYIAYEDHLGSPEYRYISDKGGMGYLFLAMALAVFGPLILGALSVVWILLRWRKECRAAAPGQSTQPTT